MFNTLILSDIHIGIYRNYNQDDFRIKQFTKLKKVIIDSILEYRKSNGISYSEKTVSPAGMDWHEEWSDRQRKRSDTFHARK